MRHEQLPLTGQLTVYSGVWGDFSEGIYRMADITEAGTIMHGDDGHFCYDDDGRLTCVIAKLLLFNGPPWRTLAARPGGINR